MEFHPFPFLKSGIPLVSVLTSGITFVLGGISPVFRWIQSVWFLRLTRKKWNSLRVGGIPLVSGGIPLVSGGFDGAWPQPGCKWRPGRSQAAPGRDYKAHIFT